MKRVPLKRSAAGLRRTGRLRPRSAKTAKLYRDERTPLNRELVDEPRLCAFPLGCTSLAESWHEYHTRGQGGSIVDRENLYPSCLFHNGYAEDHPVECHDLGWRYSAKRAAQLAVDAA